MKRRSDEHRVVLKLDGVAAVRNERRRRCVRGAFHMPLNGDLERLAALIDPRVVQHGRHVQHGGMRRRQSIEQSLRPHSERLRWEVDRGRPSKKQADVPPDANLAKQRRVSASGRVMRVVRDRPQGARTCQ